MADDLVVYNVNTDDWSKSTVSDFASIPVTADYSYATKNRQAVYVVFDKNWKQADSAKVRSIYYFTPQTVTDGKPVWDVQTMSSLLADKGNDPVSGKPYVAINATTPLEAPYTRSTEPFAIVKDTFYFVGDNEVAIYLFKADMGTKDPADDKLIMLDAGWPCSGYQYWKNIEAVGFDPRKITDFMLTHGHLDHYGVAMELVNMIENSGGKVNVYGSKDDTFGLTKDAMGNPWNIRGALPADETGIRAKTNITYEMDKYYDFIGNVRIMVTPTPGHTPGTGSFIFKVKNPDSGDWITFGYMGGYGFNGPVYPEPLQRLPPSGLPARPGLAAADGGRRLRRPPAHQSVPDRGCLPGAQGLQQRSRQRIQAAHHARRPHEERVHQLLREALLGGHQRGQRHV